MAKRRPISKPCTMAEGLRLCRPFCRGFLFFAHGDDNIINNGQIFSRVKMIVNAELYVKDLPGQLVGSLEPISMVDGNIMGVVHDREQIVNHRISLNVTFEVEDTTQLKRLEDIWKSRDVIISSIGSVYSTFSMEYLLIGHITASYIERLMDEASQAVTIDSIDIQYSSKNHDEKRTAMISVKVREECDLDRLDRFLRYACREGAITYIRGL
ncbi:MAG: hypothetical protein PWR17_1305 [Candidatus Methanomethylophilaceae archaeon]|nr:hypothetical protein [Candidatus Methanomethylophilaceae archaeon]